MKISDMSHDKKTHSNADAYCAFLTMNTNKLLPTRY